MSLSFPRAFPSVSSPRSGWFDSASFQPVFTQSQALTGGGSPNAAELAPQRWSAEYSTTMLNEAELETWDAWLASLGGGLRTFKGVPSLRAYPRAYPTGFSGLTYSGSPFSGSGNLSAIATPRDEVTINQLPTGFVLNIGDFFSIPVGSRQQIHKLTTGGTASGGSVTVGVTPTIRPGVSTGIAVLLASPWCDMVLEGTPQVRTTNVRTGSISFKGMQVLV